MDKEDASCQGTEVRGKLTEEHWKEYIWKREWPTVSNAGTRSFKTRTDPRSGLTDIKLVCDKSESLQVTGRDRSWTGEGYERTSWGKRQSWLGI
jgi:hypothetical protein